jgi:hypothetical protein
MFWTKVVEKIKHTYFQFNNVFGKSCRLWNNVEKSETRGTTNDVTIWRIRVACYISKTTCMHARTHAHRVTHALGHAHTHKYVIFIVFTRQQWLRERASVLRYTMYIACLLSYLLFYFQKFIFSFNVYLFAYILPEMYSTQATIRFMSVCLSAWNNSAPTGQIFIKFDIWGFFRKSVEKIKVSSKSDMNNGYLHEDLCTRIKVSLWIRLRMRNASDNISTENQNTRFMCRLWDSVVKCGRAKQTTWPHNTAHALCMLDK